MVYCPATLLKGQTMPHFTAPDGASLFYTDAGHGIPLLCLAGLTRNSSDFDYLAPHLPPLRLIRMDYRGRGKSDWTGAQTYTVPQEATDALALLDHAEAAGDDEVLLAVGHGLSLRVGALLLMGLDYSHARLFAGLRNCHWVVLEPGGEHWRMLAYNVGTG